MLVVVLAPCMVVVVVGGMRMSRAILTSLSVDEDVRVLR